MSKLVTQAGLVGKAEGQNIQKRSCKVSKAEGQNARACGSIKFQRSVSNVINN